MMYRTYTSRTPKLETFLVSVVDKIKCYVYIKMPSTTLLLDASTQGKYAFMFRTYLPTLNCYTNCYDISLSCYTQFIMTSLQTMKEVSHESFAQDFIETKSVFASVD